MTFGYSEVKLGWCRTLPELELPLASGISSFSALSQNSLLWSPLQKRHPSKGPEEIPNVCAQSHKQPTMHNKYNMRINHYFFYHFKWNLSHISLWDNKHTFFWKLLVAIWWYGNRIEWRPIRSVSEEWCVNHGYYHYRQMIWSPITNWLVLRQVQYHNSKDYDKWRDWLIWIQLQFLTGSVNFVSKYMPLSD